MRALALTLALGMMAAPATADELGMERTDPGHVRHLPSTVYEPPVHPPRTRYVRGQVVYRLASDMREVARPDRTLSHLCRLGAFVQRTPGFYWARTPTRAYGVAFSGGANLDDPQNRRQSGKVYFFQDQDSRCTVYVADQAKLMKDYVGPLPGD